MKFLRKFKSHRKAGLHPVSRKHNFGKCRGGCQIDRPPPPTPNSLFRVYILRPATLLKNILSHTGFPVNFICICF